MKRCCIFSRVSSLHQSAEEQTHELLAEAYRNGFNDDEIVIIEWTESAIKLSSSERESIQRLYKTIEENPIECVICRELSRIARRPDVLYEVRNVLIDKHIQLICCNPYMRLLEANGKMSQTASIMFSLFSSIAESEMAIKIERFKEGKLRKKNAGKWAGGFLPFGYKYDEQTHNIYADSRQAEIIRSIFNMYVNEGMSTVAIARHFNQTGELSCCRPSATVETAVSTIGSMLKNKAYIGQHPIWRGKIVDNIYPRIVTDEIFYAAAKKLNEHNSRKNKTVEISGKHLYFCKDILYDVHGNKLIGKSVANAYRYVRHQMDGHNYQITVPINMVDSLVWHYTKEFVEVFNPKTNEELINTVRKEISAYSKKISVGLQKIEENKKKEYKIQERIINGRMTESIGDSLLSKINEQSSDIMQEVIEMMSDNELRSQRLEALENDLGNSFDSMTDEQKNKLIHQYVTNVEVESLAWGEYELNISFVNHTMQVVRFKSMSKTATNPFTDNSVDFEYLERFVRPKTKYGHKDGLEDK